MSCILRQTLRGERTERRPIWIMRQAGRYLPEYRELRDKHSFEELVGTPELAAEVTMMPLRRFALDAAVIFADLMSPVAALGIPFRFAPGPVLERPLRTAGDIRALPDPDPGEVAPEVINALRLVKRELAGGVALIGFAGAPLSLAAYLVEGGAARDFPRLRALAASDRTLLGELLHKLARLAAVFLIEQVKAGADVVQVFDTWAGILSREDWQLLVKPHLRDMLEELSRAGVPRILFVYDAPHLMDDFAALPTEALSVDWRTDLGGLRRRAGPSKILQGNLDPAVLLAGPDTTRRETAALLRRLPPQGHIVNLGHGALPETPLESVKAMIEVVHAEKGTSP